MRRPHSGMLRLQSDDRLVALTRRGNQSAYEALVARYQGRLLAFCRHMLGSHEDAEDVLQEVFAAAFRTMIADERPINVKPWLYRIARNRSLNHLRTQTAIGVDSMDIHLADNGKTTADRADSREEFRELVGDVKQLAENQRTALLLREIEALSYEQIAEAMDTTVSAVKSLLVRARVSLAEAAEARRLTCDEVRDELGQWSEGLVKLSPPVRRHTKTCDRCAAFKADLAANNKQLAALFPIGPLLLLQKLFLADKASTSSGAIGGGAVGSGGAGGMLSAGIGTVVAKAATGLTAVAIATVGVVEIDQINRRAHGNARKTLAVAVAPAAGATSNPLSAAGLPPASEPGVLPPETERTQDDGQDQPVAIAATPLDTDLVSQQSLAAMLPLTVPAEQQLPPRADTGAPQPQAAPRSTPPTKTPPQPSTDLTLPSSFPTVESLSTDSQPLTTAPSDPQQPVDTATDTPQLPPPLSPDPVAAPPVTVAPPAPPTEPPGQPKPPIEVEPVEPDEPPTPPVNPEPPVTTDPVGPPITIDPVAPPDELSPPVSRPEPPEPPVTVDPAIPPVTVDPAIPPVTVDPAIPPVTVDPAIPPVTVDDPPRIPVDIFPEEPDRPPADRPSVDSPESPKPPREVRLPKLPKPVTKVIERNADRWIRQLEELAEQHRPDLVARAKKYRNGKNA